MSNLLSGATSPYLLQHADNPVHWQPWGPDALAQAQREGKPILLSIGYAACHWCHVMAHESFEDPATAAVMNANFVNIKVDREERPDLDQIYQAAHELLTRKNGGWPLTVFLAPDGTPFHSGTYYPPEPRHGRPAFGDLLESVHQAWQDKRGPIEQQNTAVRAALQARSAPVQATTAQGQPVPPADLRAALAGPVQQAARSWLGQTYDAVNGGFGGAPKFPHPIDVAWLLERGMAEGDTECQDHALHTLRQMALGGLYDQLGGGFFRYSTDERWEIPHFEKMLSDNGLLLGLYADALAHTGEPLFARVVEDTAGWLMREMQGVWPVIEDDRPAPGTVAQDNATKAGEPKVIAPLLPAADDGTPLGYHSSLDADSEGEEGRYYAWAADDLRGALTPLEWDLASAHWNLIEGPNFEGRHWHLRVARPTSQLSRTLGQPLQALEDILATSRLKLLRHRSARVRPARDDKVLTAWNALAITGMAKAASVMGRPDWLRSARRALDFIRQNLWVADPSTADASPRLLATWRDGHAHLNAYLDDHAFLLEALLTLVQVDFRPEDLSWARDVADALLTQFEDPEHGGFFFTRHDHEALIQRPRSGQDQALPSGGATAAWALQRLGHLTGESRWLKAAERTLQAFGAEAARQPGGWSRLLQVAVESEFPPTLVVLRGPQASEWRDSLLHHAPVHTLVVAVPDGPADLPAVLDKPATATTQAWVCHAETCSPPEPTLSTLLEGLGLRQVP